jgi:hypothetical protein
LPSAQFITIVKLHSTIYLTFHLIYLPEIIIQTFAFAWVFVVWEHHPGYRLTIPLVVVFFLIVVMNAFPFLQFLTG